MLRACRRVLTESGRLVFSVVSVPEGVVSSGVSLDAYEFVATGTPYVDMLTAAGFVDIHAEDATDAYMTIAKAWLDAIEDLEVDLRRALGDSIFDDKVSSRRAGLVQLEAGELGRTLFSATAAG
ncbi:MAG: hypothetical protein BMS9Abin17_1748 [Acidimicrobiia bacterium]|nr:MAG: hypothetical protein BMS9Abin17_1748 [Acidimicrobiia bacterium]